MALEVIKADVTPKDGLKMLVSARGMEFVLDEPEEMGGTNTGMNPLEAFLGGLGACYAIVILSFAQPHKMKINKLNVRVEGDLDMDGFMGLNKEAKVGFEEIRIFMDIEADNTPEEINDYIRFVEVRCPISDTLDKKPLMKSIVNGEALA